MQWYALLQVCRRGMLFFLDRTHWLQACSIMLRGIISNQTCSKKTAGSESIRLLSFTKYKWWFITEVIIINGYIIIYGILHSIHGFLNVLLTSSNYSIHGVNQQTQLDFPPNLRPCFLLQDGEPPKRKKRRIPSSTVGFFVPTVDFIKWAWTYQESCWKVKPPEKAG